MKRAISLAIVMICLVPLAAPAQTFVTSPDGAEVTDSKTGLIWRRCVEGMIASGSTCTGRAASLAYKAALQQATTQAGSTGVAWRLPKIRELVSITDSTRSNPAIDVAAFPGTPPDWFWSGSTYADDPGVMDLLGENTKKSVALTVSMNSTFGGSNSTAVWGISFSNT